MELKKLHERDLTFEIKAELVQVILDYLHMCNPQFKIEYYYEKQMKDDDKEEISEPSESDLLNLQLKTQRKNSKKLAEKHQVKAEELSKTARSKLKQ